MTLKLQLPSNAHPGTFIVIPKGIRNLREGMVVEVNGKTAILSVIDYSFSRVKIEWWPKGSNDA